MNRLRKSLMLVLVLALMAASFAPMKAKAASAEANVKKLVRNMSSYEYTKLFNSGLESGQKKEIKLNARQKAIAAALAVDLTKNAVVEEVGPEEMYTTYFIKNATIRKLSKKLFGKAVSDKKLPLRKTEKVHEFLAAYRTYKGRAVVYVWMFETETDFEEISLKVKKDGDGYLVTKDVYQGYWGGNDHKTANYRITYKVAANAKSSYGYVITGMTIEHL